MTSREHPITIFDPPGTAVSAHELGRYYAETARFVADRASRTHALERELAGRFGTVDRELVDAIGLSRRLARGHAHTLVALMAQIDLRGRPVFLGTAAEFLVGAASFRASSAPRVHYVSGKALLAEAEVVALSPPNNGIPSDGRRWANSGLVYAITRELMVRAHDRDGSFDVGRFWGLFEDEMETSAVQRAMLDADGARGSPTAELRRAAIDGRWYETLALEHAQRFSSSITDDPSATEIIDCGTRGVQPMLLLAGYALLSKRDPSRFPRRELFVTLLTSAANPPRLAHERVLRFRAIPQAMMNFLERDKSVKSAFAPARGAGPVLATGVELRLRSALARGRALGKMLALYDVAELARSRLPVVPRRVRLVGRDGVARARLGDVLARSGLFERVDSVEVEHDAASTDLDTLIVCLERDVIPDSAPHPVIDVSPESAWGGDVAVQFTRVLGALPLPPFDDLAVLKRGESKDIRRLGDLAVARYLDTTSSHTHGQFGEIPGSERLRIHINDLAQRWLQRRGIETAYRGLWYAPDGQCYAVEQPVYSPPIEVIVKSRLAGTPVQRYLGIERYRTRRGQQLQLNVRYPDLDWHVRFDWRNPARAPFQLSEAEWQHIQPTFDGLLEPLATAQGRVTVAVIAGQQKAYAQRIRAAIRENAGIAADVLIALATRHFKPDEPMPEELADYFIDVAQARGSARRAVSALQSVLAREGLELWDICLTLTEDGRCLFGEITPDGARIKQPRADGTASDTERASRETFEGYLDFDKDIWRTRSRVAPGEAADVMVERWEQLREMFGRSVLLGENPAIEPEGAADPDAVRFDELPQIASGNSYDVRAATAEQLAIRLRPTIYSGQLDRVFTVDGSAAIRTRFTVAAFRWLRLHGVPTHFVRKLGDDLIATRAAKPAAIETIVKAYHVGSDTRRYDAAAPCRDGTVLHKGDAHTRPIVEFTYRNRAPKSDEIIADDLAERWIAVAPAKLLARRAFACFADALSQAGYELLDACIFLDEDATMVLGELSPDNTRIRRAGSSEPDINVGKRHLNDPAGQRELLDRWSEACRALELVVDQACARRPVTRAASGR